MFAVKEHPGICLLVIAWLEIRNIALVRNRCFLECSTQDFKCRYFCGQ
jgi:hypothetical protein